MSPIPGLFLWLHYRLRTFCASQDKDLGLDDNIMVESFRRSSSCAVCSQQPTSLKTTSSSSACKTKSRTSTPRNNQNIAKLDTRSRPLSGPENYRTLANVHQQHTGYGDFQTSNMSADESDTDSNLSVTPLLTSAMFSPMAVPGVGELTILRELSQLNVFKFHQISTTGHRKRRSEHFHIVNNSGQLLFTVTEMVDKVGSRGLCCCKEKEMVFKDNAGVEVLNFNKPFLYYSLCYGDDPEMIIYSQGRLIGVVQRSGALRPEPNYSIKKDFYGRVCYEVSGWSDAESNTTSCRANSGDNYKLYSVDGSGRAKRNLGYLRKDWTGMYEPYSEGYYTDHFALNVRQDLRVDVKVLFLGAAFLIHFLTYEAKCRSRCAFFQQVWCYTSCSGRQKLETAV